MGKVAILLVPGDARTCEAILIENTIHTTPIQYIVIMEAHVGARMILFQLIFWFLYNLSVEGPEDKH